MSSGFFLVRMGNNERVNEAVSFTECKEFLDCLNVCQIFDEKCGL